MQNGAPQPTPAPMVTATAPEEPLPTGTEDDQTFDLAGALTKAALSVLDNVLALL